MDADYKFVFVDIGGYGSEGDSGLLQQTTLGQRLDSATSPYDQGGLEFPYDNFLPGTGVQVPHVFLGDEGFGLQRHLMRPYRRQTATGTEATFNYRLSRPRRIVENAFGILTTRFRVLESRIDLGVKTAIDVVKACVSLHNYLKSTDSVDHATPRYLPDHYVDYENDQHELITGDWRNQADHEYALPSIESTATAARSQHTIRDKFKRFFVSDEGRVPWQDNAFENGLY